EGRLGQMTGWAAEGAACPAGGSETTRLPLFKCTANVLDRLRSPATTLLPMSAKSRPHTADATPRPSCTFSSPASTAAVKFDPPSVGFRRTRRQAQSSNASTTTFAGALWVL